MLQTLERAGRDSHDTRMTAGAAPAKVATSPAKAHIEQDDGLAAAAGPIMLAAYAVVLAVAVLTFKASGEALLAVSVGIVLAIVFFGVPLTMMRVRARHDPRWCRAQARRSDKVGTFTGPVGRAEAVLHMVIVPLVVCAAFASFALIWVLCKP